MSTRQGTGHVAVSVHLVEAEGEVLQSASPGMDHGTLFITNYGPLTVMLSGTAKAFDELAAACSAFADDIRRQA